MSPTVYNIAMLLGTLATSAGCGLIALAFGGALLAFGAALACGGLMVVVLTASTARLIAR